MLGAPGYKPHVVEFIRGVGVKIDGVAVQDIGGTGPFTWVVPDDVARIEDVALVGGGQGGEGGATVASMISAGGGRGGQAGKVRFAPALAVLPGSSLTVTVGAGGAGGAAGSAGGNAGDTSLAGILPGASYNVPTQLTLAGGNSFMGSNAPTASTSAATAGGGTASTDIAGTNTSVVTATPTGGMTFHETGTSGGLGGGAPAGSAVGKAGGMCEFPFGAHRGIDYVGNAAAGTFTGGVSRGGGGQGGMTGFGRGGNGGSDSAGADSTSYGGGGGGGAGGYGGGAGGSGYARFTYWSER